MFDERRHRITAGIDKSYLLDPILVEPKTTTTTKRVIAPTKPTRYDQKMSNYSKVIVPPLQNRVNHDINGNNHFSVNDDPLDRTFRGGELKGPMRPVMSEKVTVTKTVGTRKLTPAVTSSSPPLKNVTNQKVSGNVIFGAFLGTGLILATFVISRWHDFQEFHFSWL